MAKITAIQATDNVGDSRTSINTAMASVETDASLTGDGNVGTPLSVAGGGSVPSVAWEGTSFTAANNEQKSITHNLSISESTYWKYKLVLIGIDSTNHYAWAFGENHGTSSRWGGEGTSPSSPAVTNGWAATLPNNAFTANWQANTVGIKLGASATGLDYYPVITQIHS